MLPCPSARVLLASSLLILIPCDPVYFQALSVYFRSQQSPFCSAQSASPSVIPSSSSDTAPDPKAQCVQWLNNGSFVHPERAAALLSLSVLCFRSCLVKSEHHLGTGTLNHDGTKDTSDVLLRCPGCRVISSRSQISLDRGRPAGHAVSVSQWTTHMLHYL